MPRYFRRFAEGVFDMEDLKYRTDELADFVKSTASHYGFDPKTVVCVGYSNGANIGVSLLLIHPSVLRGAILFRPMVPLVPERTPNLSTRQLYISAGLTDPIVPRNETERLARMLRQYGATVTLNYVHSGHAITGQELEDARTWLQQQKF